MADIKIAKQHGMDMSSLRAAVTKAVQELEAERGITCSRYGDTWTIGGTGVKGGRLAITPSTFDLELDLAWWVPKGVVTAAVWEKVDEILG